MQKEVSYETAIRSQYPTVLFIAIIKDKNGIYNPITLGWAMCTSHRPPMFAISIGETRYSLEAIRHSKEFTLSLPSKEMLDVTFKFGTKSGRDINKIEKFNIAVEPTKIIDSVILSDAVSNFECVVKDEFKTGDHYIFTGTVVASYLNDERKSRLYAIDTGYKLGEISVVKNRGFR